METNLQNAAARTEISESKEKTHAKTQTQFTEAKTYNANTPSRRFKQYFYFKCCQYAR